MTNLNINATVNNNIAVNNNLVKVDVTKLINDYDNQYGVCYHIYHTGSGITAEVNALIEAEALGLVPDQEYRDCLNMDVWSQVHLAFNEVSVTAYKEDVTMPGATTFRPSLHVAINLPITPAMGKRIADVASSLLHERLKTGGLHKASDVESILWKLGVATSDGMDHLIYGDSNGRWRTVSGAFLIRKVASYDYSNYGVERVAGAEPTSGEVLVEFGCSATAYVGLAPQAYKLPNQVAEYLHTYVCRNYDSWAAEVLAAQKAAQKVWGQRMNEALEAFGLSKAEKSAWWNLSWKKEWSAERWAEFCRAYSDTQLSAGLAANQSGNRTDYFKVIGIRIEGSIPRTQDVVESLAKAKGLKPSYDRAWRKTQIVDAIAASTDNSGARTWSF
jgi:hypothetical protein